MKKYNISKPIHPWFFTFVSRIEKKKKEKAKIKCIFCIFIHTDLVIPWKKLMRAVRKCHMLNIFFIYEKQDVL